MNNHHNAAGTSHHGHHDHSAPSTARSSADVNPVTNFGSGNELIDPRGSAEADRSFPGMNPNPNTRAL